MGPVSATLNGLRRYSDFSGRSTRAEYWWFWAVVWSVGIGLYYLDWRIWSDGNLAFFQITMLYIALLLMPVLAVTTRRLHDTGLSGWWQLLSAASTIGAIVLLALLLRKSNPRGARFENSKVQGWQKALLVSFVVSLIYVGGRYEPYWIPSGSSKPALLIGDYLFADQLAYGVRCFSPNCSTITLTKENRGDIVVFRHPVNEYDFIKRLIGLPGDKIQMIAGVLQINGQAVGLAPAGAFEEINEPQGRSGGYPRCKNPTGVGGICSKSQFIETLPNGVNYIVLDIAMGPLDDTGLYTVPEGHYFFLGDNRDNSTDSRVVQNAGGIGYVPAKNIIGRVDRVMFSSAGRRLFYFWTWRSDRFFKVVE